MRVLLVEVIGDVGEAVDEAAVHEDLGRPFPVPVLLLIGLRRLDDGGGREDHRRAVNLILVVRGR